MAIMFPSALDAIEAAYQQAMQQAVPHLIPVVANNPQETMVANVKQQDAAPAASAKESRHGKYADKATRREYMRNLMAAKRAKVKAQHV